MPFDLKDLEVTRNCLERSQIPRMPICRRNVRDCRRNVCRRNVRTPSRSRDVFIFSEMSDYLRNGTI